MAVGGLFAALPHLRQEKREIKTIIRRNLQFGSRTVARFCLRWAFIRVGIKPTVLK